MSQGHELTYDDKNLKDRRIVSLSKNDLKSTVKLNGF